MDGPTISLLTAIAGVLTFDISVDAGFPLAVTTFWVIDPATGQPAFGPFGPFSTPTGTVTGLDENRVYHIVAQSLDVASSTLSPPSLPIVVNPIVWDNKLKTVIVSDPKHGVRLYELRNKDTDAVIDTSIYPTFVDSQVFADEILAQDFNYTIAGLGTPDQEGETVEIVRRYRTLKAQCLVTGELATPGGSGGYNNPIIFRYSEGQTHPQDPAPVQRAYGIGHDVVAYVDYLGRWGVHLLQGALLEMWSSRAQAPRNRIEVIIPAVATVEFVDLAQVPRPVVPKRT